MPKNIHQNDKTKEKSTASIHQAAEAVERWPGSALPSFRTKKAQEGSERSKKRAVATAQKKTHISSSISTILHEIVNNSANLPSSKCCSHLKLSLCSHAEAAAWLLFFGGTATAWHCWRGKVNPAMPMAWGPEQPGESAASRSHCSCDEIVMCYSCEEWIRNCNPQRYPTGSLEQKRDKSTCFTTHFQTNISLGSWSQSLAARRTRKTAQVSATANASASESESESSS